LSALQSAVTRSRQEVTALRLQLESLKYAADLTRDEVTRRSHVASPSSLPSSPAPSAPPGQLEARLLEAKGTAATARRRVEQLYFHAQTLRRRTRIDASDASDTRRDRASPRATRRKAKRNIADVDALVAPSPEHELLPCRITISADCILSVYPVTVASGSMSAAAEPILQLCPPFSRVSDVTVVSDVFDRGLAGPPRPLTIALRPWMSSMKVQAKSTVSSDSTGELLTMFGLKDAIADAHALINGRAGLLTDKRVCADQSVSLPASESTVHGKASKRPMRLVKARDSLMGNENMVTSTVQLPDQVESGVLSKAALSSLLRHVPARFSGSCLRLLYSTREHGMSLISLYQRCADKSPTVVAVRDKDGARFGCFVTAPWKRNPRLQFYGSGESFCWTSNTDGDVAIHTWTRENNYFQCSTADFLAVGGGGHFAFRIDADLHYGSSGQSDTFRNPCLASSEDFECVVFEIWALDLPRTYSSSSLLIL
jgi:TLD